MMFELVWKLHKPSDSLSILLQQFYSWAYLFRTIRSIYIYLWYKCASILAMAIKLKNIAYKIRVNIKL